MLLMTRRPSATTSGERGEIRVCEHDLRYLTGNVASRGHGDGTVGFLEREHVVYAVAGHGDRVPLFLSARTSRRFISGVTRPNTTHSRAAFSTCSSVSSVRASTAQSASGIPRGGRPRKP